jgi:hypothetical protein
MILEVQHPWILLTIIIVIFIWAFCISKIADDRRKEQCHTTHNPIVVWRGCASLFLVLIIVIIIMICNRSLYFGSRLPNKYPVYDSNGNRGLYSWQSINYPKSFLRGPDKI